MRTKRSVQSTICTEEKQNRLLTIFKAKYRHTISKLKTPQLACTESLTSCQNVIISNTCLIYYNYSDPHLMKLRIIKISNHSVEGVFVRFSNSY